MEGRIIYLRMAPFPLSAHDMTKQCHRNAASVTRVPSVTLSSSHALGYVLSFGFAWSHRFPSDPLAPSAASAMWSTPTQSPLHENAQQ